MRLADDGEPGQQKVEDLSALFVIVTDDAYFPFEEPYLRKVSIGLDGSQELEGGILTCDARSPISVAIKALSQKGLVVGHF